MTTYQFPTDAALKSAIARDCPNVAIRKCNEYNEWHIQPKGQRWTDDSNRAFIDCCHDKAAQAYAREDAYDAACRMCAFIAPTTAAQRAAL